MKPTLLFIFLFLFITIIAGQSIKTFLPKDSTGKVVFTAVVNVDSIDAKKLFSKTKIFVAKKFNSAKDAIQIEDENLNTIVCNGTLPSILTLFPILKCDAYISYKLTVETKDNKYRYTINDLVYNQVCDGRPSRFRLESEMDDIKTRKNWDDVKEAAAVKVLALISNLKDALAQHKSDDW